MKFTVSSRLQYYASDAAKVICSLSCKKSPTQKISGESLTTNRQVERNDLIVGLEGNRFVKFDIPEAGEFSIDYQATVRTRPKLVDYSQIGSDLSSAFHAMALPYLAPSRYAQADQMRNEASELFGGYQSPIDQALAIEDWLFQNICYSIGSSNEQSGSLETFQNRSGVCRDFAHLGIALCRALNIPARYVTVYSYQLEPQDFHAVFEVYVDGRWFLIDGTRLAPLNGMVRIATGLDAAETPLGSLFGPIQGQGVEVWTEVASNQRKQFSPINRESLRAEDKVLQLP